MLAGVLSVESLTGYRISSYFTRKCREYNIVEDAHNFFMITSEIETKVFGRHRIYAAIGSKGLKKCFGPCFVITRDKFLYSLTFTCQLKLLWLSNAPPFVI